MFRAMQQGKAGRTATDLPAGAPMRDLFRHSEDMLTATVFERLSYLPGPVAWGLLCGTLHGLPVRRMVELVDIEFWPRWSIERDDASWVEPDVMLTLDLGDPARRTLLLIEVKTAGGQTTGQWKKQLDTLRTQIEADDPEIDVIFAALGGIDANSATTQWASLPAELRKGIDFVYGNWNDLGKALATYKPTEPGHQRALEDIAQALALYGYTTIILSDALMSLPRLNKPDPANEPDPVLDTLLKEWMK